MKRLFGTDGIRGIFNDNLTIDLATRAGKAIAYVLGKEKKIKVLIGRDTRYSGEILSLAISSGLMNYGADITNVGIIPTPAIPYLVKEKNFDIGIMISASHNPAKYNGIKIFNNKGYKLDDDLEEKIEEYILDKEIPRSEIIGTYNTNNTLKKIYIKFLKTKANNINKNLKIIVDCANGSASVTAPILFKELGLNYTTINSEYNGYNINSNCGSTKLENLQNSVLKNNADLGISYDGDADRCLFVDKNGEVVNGDNILAICGKYYKDNKCLKNNTIVGTILSNLGLKIFCQKEGINFIDTKVGDKYIIEEMLKNDYIIGGEQSGHIIFRQYLNTGDGELTSIEILNIISKTNKDIIELKNIMDTYPQIAINVEITKEYKYIYLENKNIINYIKSCEKELGNNGRIIVRASGTENVIRIMIEGKNIEDITKKATHLKDLILYEYNNNIKKN